MAVVLWGSKTPGERERDRDRAVSNNKKKVSTFSYLLFLIFTYIYEGGNCEVSSFACLLVSQESPPFPISHSVVESTIEILT